MVRREVQIVNSGALGPIANDEFGCRRGPRGLGGGSDTGDRMRLRTRKHLAALLACGAMLIPTPLPAESGNATPVTDVALHEGGLLIGQLLDAQGRPQSGQTVAVVLGDQPLVQTTSDASGYFAARGLRGGRYQIVAHDQSLACRAWAPATAPPAAHTVARMVAGEPIVRGQAGPPYGAGYPCHPGPGGKLIQWMKEHPWMTASAVAIAVAVPLAVADDHDPAS